MPCTVVVLDDEVGQGTAIKSEIRMFDDQANVQLTDTKADAERLVQQFKDELSFVIVDVHLGDTKEDFCQLSSVQFVEELCAYGPIVPILMVSKYTGDLKDAEDCLAKKRLGRGRVDYAALDFTNSNGFSNTVRLLIERPNRPPGGTPG